MRLVPVMVVLALLSCGAPDPRPSRGTQQQSIVGGIEDDHDVAVVELTIAGLQSCSGSLLAPSTVLTAAHCAVPSGMEWLLSVDVHPAAGGQVQSFGVALQHVHPGWSSTTGDHDLNLLQLSAPVTGIAPLRLFSRALTAADVGQPVRVVGYGATQGSSSDGKGTRREVTLAMRQLLALTIEAGATGKQACDGDSGGPALMRPTPGGPELIAAITTDGDQACLTTGYFARVDNEVAWIVSTAQAWDVVATCAADGVCTSGCWSADPDCAPPPDAGSPVKPDAGSPLVIDAGSPVKPDAGSPVAIDAGSPSDPPPQGVPEAEPPIDPTPTSCDCSSAGPSPLSWALGWAGLLAWRTGRRRSRDARRRPPPGVATRGCPPPGDGCATGAAGTRSDGSRAAGALGEWPCGFRRLNAPGRF